MSVDRLKQMQNILQRKLDMIEKTGNKTYKMGIDATGELINLLAWSIQQIEDKRKEPIEESEEST